MLLQSVVKVAKKLLIDDKISANVSNKYVASVYVKFD